MNMYAFTQQAKNVTIKYLTIQNFVAPMNEGTVNHDSGEDWTMQYLTVSNNGGAGIFLGAGNVASYNCLKDNSQYGFQAYNEWAVPRTSCSITTRSSATTPATGG